MKSDSLFFTTYKIISIAIRFAENVSKKGLDDFFCLTLSYIAVMKRLLIISLVMCLLQSCSRGVSFDIEGRLAQRAASTVYLVVQNIETDTLASAPVHEDNTFRLRGRIDEPTTAFICDDNGNALAMLMTEESPITLRALSEGGYIAEGGPINDKYNLIVNRLSDVAQQIMTLTPEDAYAEEQYEALVAKYNEILSTAITDNLDNIIGVELFTTQESRSMTAEDMRVRLNQFSAKMRALKPMREFERYIETYALSEVGQPFIDVEVESITGEKISLSQICGKGKWILLDFWATWCDPCLQELPTLQEAYNRYALKGFEIFSISLDRDAERWRAFVAQNKLLWSHGIDTTEQLAAEAYGLQTIPANFLISPDGEIVARNLHGEYLLHELEHRFE